MDSKQPKKIILFFYPGPSSGEGLGYSCPVLGMLEYQSLATYTNTDT